MKEKIIKSSISRLREEGLRFSIDEVAKELKISKKTIYKYFSAKEDLAVAIYKTFYEDAINRIESIENAALSEKSAVEQMLTVYFQSYCMVRKEIFNKYSLNDGIRLLAQDNHGKIGLLIENKLPQSDKDALMIIIDGSLKELCERKEYEKKVIAGLVKLLC